MAATESNASNYEAQHVHEVYDQIASHFSSTRYKPWPVVERFLQKLPPGSIGVDAGCGNGKYLCVRQDVFIIGSDRSPNLISFAAKHEPHSALVADSLFLPHPLHTFDFAISIAVIHHLSTPARRIEAVKALLDVLKPNGRALIFVWALEQKDSRRGWDAGQEQDVMVPWVMKVAKPRPAKVKKNKLAKSPTVVGEGAEADAEDVEQEITPSAAPLETSTQDTAPSGDRTFNRYYHLYKSGELDTDIRAAGGVVEESGYERDNWWAILRRESV